MIPSVDLQQKINKALHQQADREAMAKAGLAGFFALTEEWGLQEDQKKALLGQPKKSRYYDLKKGKTSLVSDDELDRLAYLGGIYVALNILYPGKIGHEWLNNTTASPGMWHTQSPLEHMAEGKMEGIIDVYRYLNYLRGAN